MSKFDDKVLLSKDGPLEEKTAGAAKGIVLITGIGGFLGLSLSKALAQDYCVVDLDRLNECSRYPDCVPCDLTSNESVNKAMDELRRRFGSRFVSCEERASRTNFDVNLVALLSLQELVT